MSSELTRYGCRSQTPSAFPRLLHVLTPSVDSAEDLAGPEAPAVSRIASLGAERELTLKPYPQALLAPLASQVRLITRSASLELPRT